MKGRFGQWVIWFGPALRFEIVPEMVETVSAAGATLVFNKSSATPRQIIDALRSIFCQAPAAPVQAPPAPVAPTPPKPVSLAATQLINRTDDKAFEAEMLSTFVASVPNAVNAMRKSLQEISKSEADSRIAFVEQLYRSVRAFGSGAALAGLGYVARFGAATEALVKELLDKPKNITPSTLRTTAHAVDCFAELVQAKLPGDFAENPPIQILIADDDMLARRAIIYSLEKAFLKPVAVEDAAGALEKCASMKFDLVFLDIHMPGMDGFAVCDRIRQEGPNKETPVIFVTSTADFQARAQSTLRGASDLIAKPFLFMELTVKALTFSLRCRADQVRKGRGVNGVRPVPATIA